MVLRNAYAKPFQYMKFVGPIVSGYVQYISNAMIHYASGDGGDQISVNCPIAFIELHIHGACRDTASYLLP